MVVSVCFVYFCVCLFLCITLMRYCIHPTTYDPRQDEDSVVRRGSEWFLGDIVYYLPILSPALRSAYIRFFMTM